jgi:hypothetical protein
MRRNVTVLDGSGWSVTVPNWGWPNHQGTVVIKPSILKSSHNLLGIFPPSISRAVGVSPHEGVGIGEGIRIRGNGWSYYYQDININCIPVSSLSMQVGRLNCV